VHNPLVITQKPTTGVRNINQEVKCETMLRTLQ